MNYNNQTFFQRFFSHCYISYNFFKISYEEIIVRAPSSGMQRNISTQVIAKNVSER